jgi:hypothetical protein
LIWQLEAFGGGKKHHVLKVADAPIYDGYPWLLGPSWAFEQKRRCRHCG